MYKYKALTWYVPGWTSSLLWRVWWRCDALVQGITAATEWGYCLMNTAWTDWNGKRKARYTSRFSRLHQSLELNSFTITSPKGFNVSVKISCHKPIHAAEEYWTRQFFLYQLAFTRTLSQFHKLWQNDPSCPMHQVHKLNLYWIYWYWYMYYWYFTDTFLLSQ